MRTESPSWLDLHQRDFRDRAGGEGGEIDFEIVGVEAHRHVEQEPRGDGSASRRDVAGEKSQHAAGRIDGESGSRRDLGARDRYTYAAGDRLADRPRIGRVDRTVGLRQL